MKSAAWQGMPRSLKTWKVLEFENLDPRPGKSWNIYKSPRKSWNFDVHNYKFNVDLYFQLWAHRNSVITLLPKCQVSVCVTLMSVHCAPAFIENTGVYFCALRVREFVEIVLEFDIGRPLKVMESHSIWDVKMCMNPAWIAVGLDRISSSSPKLRSRSIQCLAADSSVICLVKFVWISLSHFMTNWWTDDLLFAKLLCKIRIDGILSPLFDVFCYFNTFIIMALYTTSVHMLCTFTTISLLFKFYLNQ